METNRDGYQQTLEQINTRLGKVIGTLQGGQQQAQGGQQSPQVAAALQELRELKANCEHQLRQSTAA
jgi:hypothetical protein